MKTELKIIFIVALIQIVLLADEPWLIYGPDATVIGKGRKTSTPSEDLIPSQLIGNEIIQSNSRRAYISHNNNILYELSSHSTLKYSAQLDTIYLISGFISIHTRTPSEISNIVFIVDSAQIRFAGSENSLLKIADSAVNFERGAILSKTGYRLEPPERLEPSLEDAQYIFGLLDKNKIPAADFRFRFPSEKPPPFRYRVRNHGGVATYQGNRYYYGGWIYRVRVYRLEMAYDIWFAASRNGFYKAGWDEWKDFVDHISYIEFNRSSDPLYLRVGLIDNLTFGHGMLVDNYSNAIFLPFEKKSGFQGTLDTKSFKSVLFLNDIGDPSVFGFNFEWRANKRLSTGFSFAGDLDQLSDIDDTDGDGFPDRIDPYPDAFNSPSDSMLAGYNLLSLKDFETSYIYSAAFGMRYKFLRHRYFSGQVSGEMAGLSNKSLGLTFPNIGLNLRWVTFGAGLDFQTPRFRDGIFDRTYESDKVRWIEDESGKLELVTRLDNLQETEGWLYGWNNSFSLSIPDYLRLSTRFRDIYRDDSRDKRFYFSLNLDYPLFKYITRTSFFIEQKNVSELLQRKTDGEFWGFGFELKPHSTITAKIRYREHFEDKNSDGEIAKNEVNKNFDGNISVDGQYWWRKLLDWMKKRKAAKKSPQTLNQ